MFVLLKGWFPHKRSFTRSVHLQKIHIYHSHRRGDTYQGCYCQKNNRRQTAKSTFMWASMRWANSNNRCCDVFRRPQRKRWRAESSGTVETGMQKKQVQKVSEWFQHRGGALAVLSSGWFLAHSHVAWCLHWSIWLKYGDCHRFVSNCTAASFRHLDDTEYSWMHIEHVGDQWSSLFCVWNSTKVLQITKQRVLTNEISIMENCD